MEVAAPRVIQATPMTNAAVQSVPKAVPRVPKLMSNYTTQVNKEDNERQQQYNTRSQCRANQIIEVSNLSIDIAMMASKYLPITNKHKLRLAGWERWQIQRQNKARPTFKVSQSWTLFANFNSNYDSEKKINSNF